MQSKDQDIIKGQQPHKKVKLNQNVNQQTEPKSELDQLKLHSIVVADTGDFNLIQKYLPEDATTNPSLILLAAKNPAFSNLIDQSIQFGLKNYNNYFGPKKKKQVVDVQWKNFQSQQKNDLIQLIYDHLFVVFGKKILQKIKGYVSTQVDAKLSFDKEETVKRAKRILALYNQAGVDSSRVLIKIASTWEGIKAGQTLLKSKIKCNMTLVFHKVQALACAYGKLFLISPFVGRILDWNKKQTGKTQYLPSEDPGVVSVTQIYNYFKKFDFKTIVMGASFRSTGQIKQLCGCDRLTIAPALLQQLSKSTGQVSLKLNAGKAKESDIQEISINQQIFRYQMNKSKMATDLLSAGIRSFQKDGQSLKEIIRKRMVQLHEKA